MTKVETRMTQDKLQINSASITDKGLSEKRPQNEDSYLELRDSGFYAVADGVGGAQAGDVASQMAMEILGEAFINLPEGGDAEERMKLAIEQANHAVFQMSRGLRQLSTMATTVVGLHINDNVATIGHVGDSRLYRIDPLGNLFRETQDHSVVEEEVRAGRMTPEQAETHPSRNVISRALGAESAVEIDMKTIMFEPGTTFLLCTDGVTRHLSDDEIRDILFAEDDTFAICKYIKDICFRRGAEDNLTAVVVKTSVDEPEFGGRDETFDGGLEEEETIAAARPETVEEFSADDTASDARFDEETVEIPEVDESEPLEISEGFGPENEIAPVAEESKTVSLLDDKELSNLGFDSDAAAAGQTEDVKTLTVDGMSGGGSDTFFKFLPWALLVGVLAFMAYFLWSGTPQTEPEAELKPEPQDIALTAFEQNRRNVDTDPAQFIAVNSADPKDAVDHYLLGRAYFLQKNYESAKTELERAKLLLPENASAGNKKVLETEIPMMLAIINTDAAKKSFEKEVEEGAKPTGGADANTASK